MLVNSTSVIANSGHSKGAWLEHPVGSINSSSARQKLGRGLVLVAADDARVGDAVVARKGP